MNGGVPRRARSTCRCCLKAEQRRSLSSVFVREEASQELEDLLIPSMVLPAVNFRCGLIAITLIHIHQLSMRRPSEPSHYFRRSMHLRSMFLFTVYRDSHRDELATEFHTHLSTSLLEQTTLVVILATTQPEIRNGVDFRKELADFSDLSSLPKKQLQQERNSASVVLSIGLLPSLASIVVHSRSRLAVSWKDSQGQCHARFCRAPTSALRSSVESTVKPRLPLRH